MGLGNDNGFGRKDAGYQSPQSITKLQDYQGNPGKLARAFLLGASKFFIRNKLNKLKAKCQNALSVLEPQLGWACTMRTMEISNLKPHHDGKQQVS